jgi:nucleotide-binding universal stress UspA family protein
MSAHQDNLTRRIVVGVDGSPSGHAALRWAVRYAELTSSTVDAVIVWQYPAALGGFGMAPVPMYEGINLGELAEKTLADAISNAVDPNSDVTVREQVVEGYPAQVLVAAAEGADLLVVGSRGHGEFAEVLLGSVSQHCVHHGPCPVLVVRGPSCATMPV